MHNSFNKPIDSLEKTAEKDKKPPKTLSSNKLYQLMKEKSFTKPSESLIKAYSPFIKQKEYNLKESSESPLIKTSPKASIDPSIRARMTQNLISINQSLILKEKAFNSLQKALEAFKSDNKDLSIMTYLENLFTLLKKSSESPEPQVSTLFTLLLTAVEEPITRILEEFTRLRTLYKDRFQDLKSQKALLAENRLLEEKNSVLQAENLRLRGSKGVGGDFLYENQKLRGILQKQRVGLCEHRRKEEKMVKLLGAIRSKGIDIEGIYNEELRSEGDSAVFEPEVYMLKENEEIDQIRTYSFREAL